VSKLPYRLALSRACLAAACGSEHDPEPGAPATRSASEQHAGLVPAPETGTAPAAEAPMAIGSLVPDGSYAWVRLASFDAAVDLLDELLRAVSGPGGTDVSTALEHLPIEGVLENIDPGRELGLAFGLVAGATRPAVTVMLPVLDKDAVIQGLRSLPASLHCFGIDDFVVATTLEEYRPGLGAATLTEGLLEGRISARIDTQAAIEQLEPLIALALQPAESFAGPGLENARAALLAGLRAAQESAERIDLAVDLDAGELDLALELVANPDTELDGALTRGSGTLYDLARCIEDGDSAALLLTLDSASIQEQLLSFFSQALDTGAAGNELEASLHALALDLGALWPLFGESLATTFQPDGAGLQATFYFEPPDRETFMSTIDAVLRSLERDLPSLRITGPVPGSVDTAYTLGFEGDAAPEARAALARWFPSGQLTLRIAERRGVTAVTIGGDELAVSNALARIARPEDQLPERLHHALDRVGDANPAFVTRLDLAALAGSGPADGAAYATCYGGVDGRVWRLGLRADLARLEGLFRQ